MKSSYYFAIYAVVFCAGALLPLSLAPLSWHIMAIVSIVGFIFCSYQALQSKQAFLIGWIYGTSLHLFGAYWIFLSIHHYGGMPPLMAGICVLLFALCLGLFYTLPAFVTFKCKYQSAHPIITSLAFASCWTLCEIAKGTVAGGFPWLFVGYALTDLASGQFARFFGVFGLSFLLTFLTCLTMLSFFKKKHVTTFQCSWPLLLLVTALPAHFTLSDKHPSPIKYIIVQPNLSVYQKWQQYSAHDIFKTYDRLMDYQSKTLSILPEGALPESSSQQAKQWLRQQNHNAAVKNGLFLFGTIDVANHRYFNATHWVGNKVGSYHKQHLVPFGEYLPLPSLLSFVYQKLHIPMSQLTAARNTSTLFSFNKHIFAPFICYEIAYTFEVASRANKSNADAFIVTSENAWFSPSIESAQHLQIARMRAIENSTPILFVANQGFSAAINASGAITNMIRQVSIPEKIHGALLTNQEKTFWTRWGQHIIIWLCVGIFILSCACLKWNND
jgi:apolipoprotein N-acyltransferase